jgi:two-component system chemotaxis response regulator CheY
MKPFRILLVDDSAPYRRQVGGALEASGLLVVEATEGFEAMWRARADATFDLVLLDIHMPSLDGLTFIREVRKIPGYSEVPIIVVTSDGSRERRLEGRAAGATAWLLKPPDLPGLINAVHAALMRGSKTESSSQRPRSGVPSWAPFEPRPGSELPARTQRGRLRSEPSPASSRPSAFGLAEKRGPSLPPAAERGTLPPGARGPSLPAAPRVSLPTPRVSLPPASRGPSLPAAPRVSLPPASRVSSPPVAGMSSGSAPRSPLAPARPVGPEKRVPGQAALGPTQPPSVAAAPASERRPELASKPPVEIDD